MLNLTDYIIRYEAGELDEGEVVTLFQALVKTGLINELQGSYQRAALALFFEGKIDA